MIELTDAPIDARSVYERISHEGAGSIVVHFGVVKPVAQGKRTRGIRFTPQGDLKEEIRSIEVALREKWAPTDVLLIRRVGELSIGDIILAAAVSSPDRESAFGACSESVERFKKLKKVKKEELFDSVP
ncbi:MAG: molybdenum cofactor biosynthesis protein MoaE [Candidatus Lindowbacteria bacterium]|nr:molybdenum cofactor biosynthesis protein MoaE [Candidatus Lindowbacteria bacterium]